MAYIVICGLLTAFARSQPILSPHYYDYEDLPAIPSILDVINGYDFDQGDDMVVPELDSKGLKVSREFQKQNKNHLFAKDRRRRTFSSTNKKFSLETKLALKSMQ